MKKDKTSNTIQLYTSEDVKAVRKMLYVEQKQTDRLTKLALPEAKAVLDHNHKTQYVRGVIDRHCNVALGKIENLWSRYVSWWYQGSMADFLRLCADYMDTADDHRYRHPGAVVKLKSEFAKLTEKEKTVVLTSLGLEDGAREKERNSIFSKYTKSQEYDYKTALDLITESKNRINARLKMAEESQKIK